MTAELPAATHIGRVALRVADLDRAVSFYTDVVGFAVVERGNGTAVLGVDDDPLLALIDAPDAPERGVHEAGLFHVAVRVPSRAALGTVLDRFESRWRLTGASDHLVSEALYARDPEGNGIEVYRDRPRAEWPDGPDGRVAMDTLPLDRDAVRAAASSVDRSDDEDGAESEDEHSRDILPDGTDIGHVHLETTDLDRARSFYTDIVGLTIRQEMDGATFLAAGNYHHHLGLNVWNRRNDPTGDGLGLAWYELVLPADALAALRERLERSGATIDPVDDRATFEVADPDGVGVRFRADPLRAERSDR